MSRRNKPSARKKTSGKKKNSEKSSNLDKFLRTELLDFLKRNKKSNYTSKQLSVELQLFNQVANNKIRSTLDRLSEEGKVDYLEKGRYQYAAKSGQELVGKIQVTNAGFAFLLMENEEDVFINPTNIGKAMDGDTVKVRVLETRRKNSKRTSGEVIEVVARARTEFVGIVDAVGKTAFIVADDPRIKMEFYVNPDNLNGAQNGEKVLVKFLNWDRRSPEVAVLQVLGKPGENNTEMHAILFQYGFNPEFPREVEAEAARIPQDFPAKEVAKRRDFRDITTFTIDPVDAKDFDDALSYRTLENGHIEVGIHIADVSYYVKPGGLIDKEAFNRATSVYLVDRTVPMLPETLSNNLCSLRPNEDKFTYSAVFEMDENATVHKRWFGRTLIHSDYRFHYGEAEQVLKGELEGPFKTELDQLNKLAYKLRDKRFATGSIDFDTPEVKFQLDDEGKPLRVIKKERGDSNRLIEDFMLLANREVATFIGNKFTNPPLPFVYRVHDQPDMEKLGRLAEFAKAFGHLVNFEEEGHTSERLNALIHSVEGKPEQNVIESIAIRSMAKAVYTIHNIGHYGLGFTHYTHFTSPIRRYPDLLVHRLVEKYLHEDYAENPVVLEEQLKHSSSRERTAAEAERASIKYKQVEFLEDKVGEEYDGIISGMIESGFFVELKENLCEGMVPTWSMEDDHYVYEEKMYAMVGRNTGQILRLGDSVRVRITGTDLRKRNIDMALVEKLEKETA